jgi:hypothetical protein
MGRVARHMTTAVRIDEFLAGWMESGQESSRSNGFGNRPIAVKLSAVGVSGKAYSRRPWRGGECVPFARSPMGAKPYNLPPPLSQV